MPTEFISKLNFNIDFHLHREKLKMSEHAALYLTHTMRALAVSLIGIFLPIYIYTISNSYMLFSSNEIINGLSWVLSYFLLRSVFTWLGILFLGRLIFKKIHFQLSMIISFVILITEIMFWYLAKGNLFLILVAGMLAGIKVTMYWIPYHIFFLRKSARRRKKFGKSTGLRFFLVRVISGIGPAIGGLIIVNFGFNVLFMTSIIALVLAALPIAFVVHEWKHQDHRIIKVIEKYLINPKYIKSNISFMGAGAETVLYSVLWPILLFIVLNNFSKIGILNTFSFLASSAAILVIGKFIDKHGTKVVHGFGSFVNAIMYLPRMIFANPYLFYALDITDRIISGTYTLPIMSLAYEKAHKRGGSDYFIFRQLSLHLGTIIGVAISLVALQFTTKWKLLFSLTMIGTLLSYFIETEKK